MSELEQQTSASTERVVQDSSLPVTSSSRFSFAPATNKLPTKEETEAKALKLKKMHHDQLTQLIDRLSVDNPTATLDATEPVEQSLIDELVAAGYNVSQKYSWAYLNGKTDQVHRVTVALPTNKNKTNTTDEQQQVRNMLSQFLNTYSLFY